MDRPEETAEKPPTPYARVGGEAGVRRIAEAFYDIVEHDPSAAQLRAMHPADLSDTREGLFEFLSFWLGGPPLYQQNPKRGCVMSAHARVGIDAGLRDVWMAAMRRALEQAGVSEEMRALLDPAFARMAEAMRNR